MRLPRQASVLILVLAIGAGCQARHVRVPLRPPKPPVLWTESFDELNRDRWHETTLHGHTTYEVVTLENHRCLKAYSHGGASILLSQIQFNPDAHDALAWDWRVDRLVEGEDLAHKAGSDAAARVYVYFKTRGALWQKRSLDYVWSASLPVGTILSSPYSPESKIVVIESGSGSLGQWRHVQRDLEDDYKRAFGTSAPGVIGIGIMSDTDNTGGEALAYFDEVRIGR